MDWGAILGDPAFQITVIGGLAVLIIAAALAFGRDLILRLVKWLWGRLFGNKGGRRSPTKGRRASWDSTTRRQGPGRGIYRIREAMPLGAPVEFLRRFLWLGLAAALLFGAVVTALVWSSNNLPVATQQPLPRAVLTVQDSPTPLVTGPAASVPTQTAISSTPTKPAVTATPRPLVTNTPVLLTQTKAAKATIPLAPPATWAIGTVYVFFTVREDGSVWGYAFDAQGKLRMPEGFPWSKNTWVNVNATGAKRILLETDLPRFSLFFDCTDGPTNYVPCDFSADSISNLIPVIRVDHPGYAVINISWADNWAPAAYGSRKRLPAEPLLRISFW